MSSIIRCRAALAAAGVVAFAGVAQASLVSYRFHATVTALSSTGSTAYSGVSVSDTAWMDVSFDPAAGPAMTSGSTYAFDYDIASLTLNIGGVNPTGSPQSLSGTTLWGFNDAVSSGNDALTFVGSFTSGEFVLMYLSFSGTSVFTVPGGGTPTMPTDLDTQTLLSNFFSVNLGGGASITLSVGEIEYLGGSRSVPAPGVAGVGACLLGFAQRRRRR